MIAPSKPVEDGADADDVPVPMITPSTVRKARSLCSRMVAAPAGLPARMTPTRHLSTRRASMGSSLRGPRAPDRCRRTVPPPPTASRRSPPPTAAAPSAPASALRTSTATTQAISTPINPPLAGEHRRFHQELVQDVAPARAQDLRMPISCVRSVTTASMMFMITIRPPP